MIPPKFDFTTGVAANSWVYSLDLSEAAPASARPEEPSKTPASGGASAPSVQAADQLGVVGKRAPRRDSASSAPPQSKKAGPGATVSSGAGASDGEGAASRRPKGSNPWDPPEAKEGPAPVVVPTLPIQPSAPAVPAPDTGRSAPIVFSGRLKQKLTAGAATAHPAHQQGTHGAAVSQASALAEQPSESEILYDTSVEHAHEAYEPRAVRQDQVHSPTDLSVLTDGATELLQGHDDNQAGYTQQDTHSPGSPTEHSVGAASSLTGTEASVLAGRSSTAGVLGVIGSPEAADDVIERYLQLRQSRKLAADAGALPLAASSDLMQSQQSVHDYSLVEEYVSSYRLHNTLQHVRESQYVAAEEQALRALGGPSGRKVAGARLGGIAAAVKDEDGEQEEDRRSGDEQLSSLRGSADSNDPTSGETPATVPDIVPVPDKGTSEHVPPLIPTAAPRSPVPQHRPRTFADAAVSPMPSMQRDRELAPRPYVSAGGTDTALSELGIAASAAALSHNNSTDGPAAHELQNELRTSMTAGEGRENIADAAQLGADERPHTSRPSTAAEQAGLTAAPTRPAAERTSQFSVRASQPTATPSRTESARSSSEHRSTDPAPTSRPSTTPGPVADLVPTPGRPVTAPAPEPAPQGHLSPTPVRSASETGDSTRGGQLGAHHASRPGTASQPADLSTAPTNQAEVTTSRTSSPTGRVTSSPGPTNASASRFSVDHSDSQQAQQTSRPSTAPHPAADLAPTPTRSSGLDVSPPVPSARLSSPQVAAPAATVTSPVQAPATAEAPGAETEEWRVQQDSGDQAAPDTDNNIEQLLLDDTTHHIIDVPPFGSSSASNAPNGWGASAVADRDAVPDEDAVERLQSQLQSDAEHADSTFAVFNSTAADPDSDYAVYKTRSTALAERFTRSIDDILWKLEQKDAGTAPQHTSRPGTGGIGTALTGSGLPDSHQRRRAAEAGVGELLRRLAQAEQEYIAEYGLADFERELGYLEDPQPQQSN
jgi:hypothetical protein